MHGFPSRVSEVIRMLLSTSFWNCTRFRVCPRRLRSAATSCFHPRAIDRLDGRPAHACTPEGPVTRSVDNVRRESNASRAVLPAPKLLSGTAEHACPGGRLEARRARVPDRVAPSSAWLMARGQGTEDAIETCKILDRRGACSQSVFGDQLAALVLTAPRQRSPLPRASRFSGSGQHMPQGH
jgi:hypothetical protein